MVKRNRSKRAYHENQMCILLHADARINAREMLSNKSRAKRKGHDVAAIPHLTLSLVVIVLAQPMGFRRRQERHEVLRRNS